ncbi:MAG: DNA polymerase IV [Pseudomonadota bacterium]
MSDPVRKIIHIDMDCFYAAIEVRDAPALKDKPVAVGGRPDRRGVLSTCNYEARKYGLHSAMPSSQAVRLCPSLIILPGNMSKYRGVSHQIRETFHDFTPLVEPLSLDEAFLDVTETKECQGSATLIAAEIRRRIFEEHQLTASAGIAPNKFLAKVASDWRKPNGQFVITPPEVADFVRALPIKKIPGVGRVTAQKMSTLGMHTCGDMEAWSKVSLREQFGKFGERLYSLCRGVDNRAVQVDSRRKSLSVETTYPEDLFGFDACWRALEDLYPQFTRRFENVDSTLPVKSIFIKMRFSDFSITTIQKPFKTLSPEVFRPLCREGLKRSTLGVRLLGLGVHFQDEKTQPDALQLPLPFKEHFVEYD